jgi:hypothetical protein
MKGNVESNSVRDYIVINRRPIVKSEGFPHSIPACILTTLINNSNLVQLKE